MGNTTQIYAGKAIANYGFPNGHPFSTKRFDAFWQEFIKRKLDKNPHIKVCDPVMANQADIALFHDQSYIDQVKHQSVTGEGYLDLGDTPAYPGVYESAAYVVGSSLHAANAIMANECQYAFVPIAGLHHARRDSASGFCVFNDCGVVIESLLTRHELMRVAYIDIDAHHGDGVYYAFESDPRVIDIDLHEDGRYLFPGTGNASEKGLGEAQGFKLNIPMPPGADDDLFFKKIDQAFILLENLRPEFFILQCGADSMAGDPLTHMAYSYRAHAHTVLKLRELADALGHNRILCLGGGGYNLENIAEGWCAVVEALVLNND